MIGWTIVADRRPPDWNRVIVGRFTPTCSNLPALSPVGRPRKTDFTGPLSKRVRMIDLALTVPSNLLETPSRAYSRGGRSLAAFDKRAWHVQG